MRHMRKSEVFHTHAECIYRFQNHLKFVLLFSLVRMKAFRCLSLHIFLLFQAIYFAMSIPLFEREWEKNELFNRDGHCARECVNDKSVVYWNWSKWLFIACSDSSGRVCECITCGNVMLQINFVWFIFHITLLPLYSLRAILLHTKRVWVQKSKKKRRKNPQAFNSFHRLWVHILTP